MNKKQYQVILKGLEDGKGTNESEGYSTTPQDKAITTLESLPVGDSAWVVVTKKDNPTMRDMIGDTHLEEYDATECLNNLGYYEAQDYEVRKILIQFVEKTDE